MWDLPFNGNARWQAQKSTTALDAAAAVLALSPAVCKPSNQVTTLLASVR
eukprot:m.489723 g.489723  ORF g.489723 m.489723 type:complete len:50 (+) comp27037_c0_seq1:109-258(+)